MNNKNNNQSVNLTKVKPFYVFPNGTRKNIEDMTIKEIEKASEDLVFKMRTQLRPIKRMRQVAEELEQQYKALQGDVFAAAHADLEEVYKEITQYDAD